MTIMIKSAMKRNSRAFLTDIAGVIGLFVLFYSALCLPAGL